jgi:hypothetical protein
MIYVGVQGSLNKYLNMVESSIYLLLKYIFKEPQTPKYIMLKDYLQK